jgi:hypothetical protein
MAQFRRSIPISRNTVTAGVPAPLTILAAGIAVAGNCKSRFSQSVSNLVEVPTKFRMGNVNQCMGPLSDRQSGKLRCPVFRYDHAGVMPRG